MNSVWVDFDLFFRWQLPLTIYFIYHSLAHSAHSVHCIVKYLFFRFIISLNYFHSYKWRFHIKLYIYKIKYTHFSDTKDWGEKQPKLDFKMQWQKVQEVLSLRTRSLSRSVYIEFSLLRTVYTSFHLIKTFVKIWKLASKSSRRIFSNGPKNECVCRAVVLYSESNITGSAATKGSLFFSKTNMTFQLPIVCLYHLFFSCHQSANNSSWWR